MKYVIRYVKPHIPTMIFGFTIKFTGTILDLMIPYILSYIIDEVTPRNDIGLVIRWGLMMAVCAALVLFPSIPKTWATVMISVALALTVAAFLYYLWIYLSVLGKKKTK